MGSITKTGNIFVCTSCCSGLLTGHNVFVDRVEWFNPVLGQESRMSTKASGNLVSHFYTTTSGTLWETPVDKWCNGLWLQSMPSGTLYVKLK